MAGSKLRFCDENRVYELSPAIKETTSEYSPEVVKGYIRQAEIEVIQALCKSFPQILNSTTWVTPSNTPLQIEYITAQIAVALIDFRYAMNNANYEPTREKFLSPYMEKLYRLRGYDKDYKTIPGEDLFNRTGEVIVRVRDLPYISTEGIDSEISMNEYATGAIADGNSYIAEGTLDKYGSDGKI